MKILRCGCLLLACTAFAVHAQAAADYPVKFVRLIVPYAPPGAVPMYWRAPSDKN